MFQLAEGMRECFGRDVSVSRRLLRTFCASESANRPGMARSRGGKNFRGHVFPRVFAGATVVGTTRTLRHLLASALAGRKSCFKFTIRNFELVYHIYEYSRSGRRPRALISLEGCYGEECTSRS